MITATKEFTFDMAHMLENHGGLCINVHGHTYKMLVTVSRRNNALIPVGPAEGMVIDFKDLKNVVNNTVVRKLDHATMINVHSKDPVEQGLWKLLQENGRKYYEVNFRPTAENMAVHFGKILDEELRNDLCLELVCLRIYETPTSYAEYQPQ